MKFNVVSRSEEDAKAKAQLEQANRALNRELEEVKSTLSQTEQTLKTTEEQKTIYHDHVFKTSNTLMATVKGLLAVLKKVTLSFSCTPLQPAEMMSSVTCPFPFDTSCNTHTHTHRSEERSGA